MVFPRMDKWSNVCGFRPLTVSLTDFKCVFMLTSTPVVYHRVKEKEDLGEEEVTVLVLLVRADDKDETFCAKFTTLRKFENDRTRT